MTNVVSYEPAANGASLTAGRASSRADALAARLEEGARLLAALARNLSHAEWWTRLPKDGRTIGVVIHHVASVYPVEISLAQVLAKSQPIVGVTMDDIHRMNAAHAEENKNVTKAETLELLEGNSAAAAAAIRALTDAQLDSAAPASLYSDATLTCQFMLEDHAVRHSYHHLAAIKRALQGREVSRGTGE